MKRIVSLCIILVTVLMVTTIHAEFNGLNMNLGNLPKLSNAKTRSISAENFTGEKFAGGAVLC